MGNAMAQTRDVECVIVGGGPGGLTAATYLGRFRRSVVVIDAGESRLNQIPLSRNIPGFPEGVSGHELHTRMRDQAERYGAQLLEGRVTRCEQDDDAFLLESSTGQFRAKAILLATGVEVTSPDMSDLERAIASGLIRYCPVCDGYEAANTRIGVLGGRRRSIEEAHFLRTYSDDVTYVPLGRGGELDRDQAQDARAAGIGIVDASCVGLEAGENTIELLLASGERRVFDTVYPCLGSSPRSALAERLGASLTEQAELITDKHMATNVPGLYAVGDVLHGLDQVASACGQAAIAATAIHNRLRDGD